MRKLINAIFVLLGFLSMGVGIVGAVVPILPTVPFLIVAAFCFAKGSKRFHTWFQETKVYKENLKSFVEERAMTRKKKARALGLMTVMLLFAMSFLPVWQGRVGLLAIILFNYTYFALGIKTITEEEEREILKRRELKEYKQTCCSSFYKKS